MNIEQLPIFQDVGRDEIDAFLKDTREASFSAGSKLFERGKPAHEVYFLVEGRVKVHVDDMDLALLRAPCVVGELELLTERPPAADVTVLDPARGYAMAGDVFRAHLRDGDPTCVQVLHNVARALAMRLGAMDDRVIEILAQRGATESNDLDDFKAKLFGEWST